MFKSKDFPNRGKKSFGYFPLFKVKEVNPSSQVSREFLQMEN